MDDARELAATCVVPLNEAIEQIAWCAACKSPKAFDARMRRAVDAITRALERIETARMASQLYPRAAYKFARKKDDGRAEAVLLARYSMEEV